jgi:hypothetical protein
VNQTKPLFVAALAIVGALAAGVAQARSDVYWSIGINAPIDHGVTLGTVISNGPRYQPAPVYYAPRPIYYAPAPVYYDARPVYVQPRHVYVEPWHGHRHGRQHHRRHDRWEGRHGDDHRHDRHDRYDGRRDGRE